MNRTNELTISKMIPASVETVFEAWLDPRALAQFIKPMDGMADCDVENDAIEGGSFLIVMKAGDKEMPHRGEYRTIQRFEKLVFTWISEHTGPVSVVTLTFKECGPKETELTLHHDGLPSEEARNNHEGGWTAIMDQLKGFVA
jgi:uncharacterized protein YndB with AHSA1/START domain